MAIIRPISAITSAIAAGLLSELFSKKLQNDAIRTAEHTSTPPTSDTHGEQQPSIDAPTILNRLNTSWRYALTDLLDDLSIWLAIGLLLAGAISSSVPPQSLTDWGSGLPAMLTMLAVSVPMYICATASTPLAAAMLQAGISPGTVLVFLLAGTATNVATLGIIRKELGIPVLTAYLSMICVSTIALGLLTDQFVVSFDIDIQAQVSHSSELIPEWFASLALMILIVFAIKPLRKILLHR